MGFVPSGLLYLLFYATQNHLPRADAFHSGLGSPTSVFGQENAQ